MPVMRTAGALRASAATNPAVTVALWVMGAFPGRAVLPYALAQFAGSAAGTAWDVWSGVPRSPARRSPMRRSGPRPAGTPRPSSSRRPQA
ncbi:aquaporin [Streptomyces sp. NPDC088732]|uniref:aquaporin n=1 Tax=Streptomyces sp. NPDC088732 TaxID=3365879 RepID=UPI003810F12F